MTHLFVTNDFPPKHGGIQSYLWELWRRMAPDSFVVLTTDHPGAATFDRAQPFRVVRAGSVLLPTPATARRIDALASEIGASLVVLDPALPLGLVGARLHRPYAVVLHGAEVTVPRRVPVASALLRRVLAGSVHVIAAGNYPAGEARRSAGSGCPPITVVPPGVDTVRFAPLDPHARAKARADLGIADSEVAVLHLSRLVPRKGADVLIRAAAALAANHRELVVLVAGGGRDRARLERLVSRTGAPVRFLGRVPDEDLPTLYGAVDVFSHVCRNRWAGLEQEGFGVVFLEAAACGIPQLAGDSGGAADAVVDGMTGAVVARPRRVGHVTERLRPLLDSPSRRERYGEAARHRAEREFDYDHLAQRLAATLATIEDSSS